MRFDLLTEGHRRLIEKGEFLAFIDGREYTGLVQAGHGMFIFGQIEGVAVGLQHNVFMSRDSAGEMRFVTQCTDQREPKSEKGKPPVSAIRPLLRAFFRFIEMQEAIQESEKARMQ